MLELAVKLMLQGTNRTLLGLTACYKTLARDLLTGLRNSAYQQPAEAEVHHAQ